MPEQFPVPEMVLYGLWEDFSFYCTKKRLVIIRGFEPFEVLFSFLFFFIGFLPLCHDIFFFCLRFASAIQFKYPSHSLLIVFHSDFHLALIKPFIGQRHGPLCPLYFRKKWIGK